MNSSPLARRALGIFGTRRLPFIRGVGLAECGAASLAMVLAYHGKHVPLAEIREVLDISAGTNAKELLRAGRHFGLEGYAAQVETTAAVEQLPRGTILHWEFRHVVVLEDVTRDGVRVCDPAVGRRFIATRDLGRSFTGLAILFEPGPGFALRPASRGYLWTQFWQVLKRPGLVVRVLVASLVLQLLALALPGLTAAITETIVPQGDQALLRVLGLALGLIVSAQFLIAWIRATLIAYVRASFDRQMIPGLLKHLMQLPFAFFQSASEGEVALCFNDMRLIREALTTTVLTATLDGIMVLTFLLLLLRFDVRLGLLAVGLGAVSALTFRLTLRRQIEATSEEVSVDTISFSTAVEMLRGIETVKAMGIENDLMVRWRRSFSRSLIALLRRGKLNAFIEAVNGCVRVGGPLFILWLGASEVISGRLALPEMLALSTLSSSFIWPFTQLVSTALLLSDLSINAARLSDIAGVATEQDPAHNLGRPALAGAVSLQSVSFAYSRLAPLAVDSVSLRLSPGEFVALVGPSGSGKSTVGKLCAGLCTPSSGTIQYDGADLTTLDMQHVRRQLGYITQHPWFWTDTIRHNICSFDDADTSLERVEKAARQVLLHEDIVAFPMGYETALSRNGTSVSGGQRQRLALARVLYRNPKMLILDEATSALDAILEKALYAEISSQRCTRLVIAHRLSTIVNADRIVVIDKGRIVDQGTHPQLLGRCALYQRLVESERG